MNKHSSPLVSIAMTVFNAVQYIEKTLISLISQDYENFELIISDNASDDGSSEICEKYARIDKRIKYFRNKTNVGMVNNGLKVCSLCSGDYIMLAADHDLYPPYYISRLLKELESDPSIVLSFGRTVFIDEHDNALELHRDTLDTRGLSARERFSKVIWEFGLGSLVYGLHRMDTFRKTWKSHDVIGPDHVITAHLSLLGTLAMVDEPLFFRRRNRPNEDCKAARKRYMDWFLSPEYEALVPLTRMAYAHIKVITESHLSSIEKGFLYSEVQKCFRARYGDELRNEAYELIKQGLKALSNSPETTSSHAVLAIKLETLANICKFFHPEIQELGQLTPVGAASATYTLMSGNAIHEEGFTTQQTNLDNKVECPICGGLFDGFLPFGVVPRKNALCPACNSLERHRLLWLFLSHKTDLFEAREKKLLDIAPVPFMSERLKQIPFMQYLSIDIASAYAMQKMDITDLDLPDESFDCIFCCHVLEHIPDDKKAMRELYRVMKPGGWGILHVPINQACEETLEDPSVTAPNERLRLYGDADHVRFYGLDYNKRLEEAGFQVQVDTFAGMLSDDDAKKFGVFKSETIYFCRKPLAKIDGNGPFNKHRADIQSPEKLVSILIPTYNRSRFLADAISSSLAQSYDNFEIVVVDDGSTDNTSEIVRGFREPKLRYIIKEHSGAPATRNRCIAEARGEFILWLDSDDVLMPDTLSRYLTMLQQVPDADVLYGNLVITDEELRPQRTLVYEDWYGRNDELLTRMVHENLIPNPGTLIRKNCFERIGLYDETFRRAHDYQWWSRLIKAANFKHVATTVLKWRWHASNLGAGQKEVDTTFEGRVLMGMLHSYPLQQLYPDIDWHTAPLYQAEAAAYLRAAIRLIEWKHFPGALEYLERSHRLSPQDEIRQLMERLRLHLSVQNPPEPAPKEKGLRVLIACDYFWPSIGGVEVIAENLGVRLQAMGHTVEVATGAMPNRAADIRRGIKILSLDRNPELETHTPKAARELRQLVGSGDYDACILLADPLNWVIWSIEGLILPSRTRVIVQPLINEEGFAIWKENNVFRSRLVAILKSVHAVVALSREGAEVRFFREELVSSVYIPNGTNLLAPTCDFRAAYKIPAEAPIFLHVANLWPVKNHISILRVLRGLGGDWRLVMIGHPSGDSEYVENVRHEASLDRRVILIPGLPPEKVAAAMEASDVVLLASHGEVSPVTIMEAMSYGKPWLATPECGAVHDFAGGIVAPLSQFPELLQKLLVEAQFRHDLGETGFGHWRACFSWEVVADAWNELIRTGELSTLFAIPESIAFKRNELTKDYNTPFEITPDPKPLVSVIVPTHNRPDMLKVAIQSILDQTYQYIEIIVVNDAGQDVANVVQFFNSPKLTYLAHKSNQGLAAARNTGIRAARGKYIAYLDDDDIYYPDHLATLVAFLEDSDYKVAYTDAYRVTQCKEGEVYIAISKDCPYSFDFDYDRILTDNFIPVLCIMHEKSCLDDLGMFDESLPRHEDWDLWIRMSRTHRFAHIPRITCEFTTRLDGSGMVSGTIPSFLRTFTRICEKYQNLIDHRPEIVAARVQQRFQMLLAVFQFMGEKIDALPEVDIDTPDEKFFLTLRKTGATDAEIASAFYQQAGVRSSNVPEKAVAFFYKALDADPDNVLARHKLTVTLVQMGDQESAARQLELQFEQNPYDSGLIGTLARFFPGRDDRKALFYLERRIQLIPDDMEARELLKEVKNRLPVLPNAIESPSQLPVRVGAFSLDAYGDACASIRIVEPLEILGDRILLLWGAVSDGVTCTTNLDIIKEADLLVVQRFYPRLGNMPYIEQMLASGKPVIYEVDDLLFNLPDTNHLKPWAAETAELLETFLPRFSAITVSTPQLKEEFSRFNSNVFVLPNLIDNSLFQPVSNRNDTKITIGFCGTNTHARDLSLIDDALFRIAQTYGDRVDFLFMGYAGQHHATLPGFRYVNFELGYQSYAQKLAGLNIDIALIPLEDNRFNRCKSNIKWLEYSACGYTGIYADLPPYNTSVEHGRTGLLAGNNPQQWYEAISLLIENDNLRRSIAANARAEVLARYTVATNAYKWLDTYQTIIRNHSAAEPASRIKVSIIVLTWNRARMLDQCLEAITNNIYYRDSYELIVGDNGSDVNTQAVLAKHKIHKLIRRETNEGLELCKELYAAAAGEIIIKIDDDILELPRHFDSIMEQYLDAFPDYGLVGLDVIRNELTNGAKPDGRYYVRETRSGLEIEQGPVVGCCMAIRRNLFTAIHGFSGEQLGMSRGEDWVLADRVRKANLQTGVMRGVTCLHACGPYYAAHYGYLMQEIQKYRTSGLHAQADAYAAYGADKPALADQSAAVVSIIIPLFNNVEYTRRCLEQLRRTTPATFYELILIDNGSTDGTYKLFEDLPPPVKVIRNLVNQGFAKACNQGAQAASGKYLLFLNNDTEPQPGWLEALLNIADQDPAVAAVGSKLLFPDGTIQHAGVVIADDRVTPDPLVGKHIYCGLPADHPEANIRRVYQAMTAACLLVRRDSFAAVDGFDEEYWNGYEDVDLCFKLGQKGWKLIYQPVSVVVHHESKSGSERFAKAAQNIKRLHEKWLGTIQPDVIIHPDSRVEWLERGASVAKVAEPLVSIIIPLFNQAQLTKACIEAIRTTTGDSRRCELILVDNGSRDWTPEYLGSLGNSVMVITNQENLGFAKACNQGTRIAKGEYLLFLNNDTVPQPGWLDALLAGAREKGADIVGAKLLYPNGRVQHAGVAFNRNGIGYHIFKNFSADAPAVNKKRFMQCVTAACMLVSRRLFNELGGFEEQFRNGFEDVDFCLRAGQSGKRILYTPDAVVMHHEEQSEGRKQYDRENMQRYLTRWQGRVRCDDEELYAVEGFSAEWHADGTCIIRPRSVQEVIHENSRYPLIPLVAHSSSSILQKLSSSQRAKGVLKRYITEN